MKEIKGYWVDRNNNSWSCEHYAKDQAQAFSDSLKNCRNCTNCINCSDCSYCSDCSDCTNCTNCTNCRNCINCINCTNCRNCINCINCSDCSYCSDCSDCFRCSDCSRCSCCFRCSDCSCCSCCSDCSNWKDSPQCYVTPRIGSRTDQTRIFWGSGRTEVSCGCFRGTLEEFEAKVKETYPNSSGHGADYRNQIEIMKMLVSNQ